MNDNCTPENDFLVSFDVVNMFPNTHNEYWIKSMECVFNTKSMLNPPALCIIEALHLCFKCNNSILNNKFYFQTDRTAQSPHMSCSYSNIVVAVYDEKPMDHPSKKYLNNVILQNT